MAKKKGILSALFSGAGGKKSGRSRSSKPKAKTSSSKSKSAASKLRAKRSAPKMKSSDVRKIYKTTDGYFSKNDKINKERRVAVIQQRKDDGALAVCKIFSKEGKNIKSTRFVQGLTLTPKKHKSLTEDSIVESIPRMGVKDKETKEFKIIKSRDFEPTGDKLTKKEHQAIMQGLGGGNKQYKKTQKNLLKNWRNHFKK